ncbi:MAG: hypothetical protein AB7V44_17835 [Pseudonocardia sp.]
MSRSSVPPAPRPPGPDGGGEPVPASAVAGLAREVDALRRAVAELDGLPERVDGLHGVVTRLTDTVASVLSRPGPKPAPSWLSAPTDREQLAEVLEGLCGWLHAVYLRYSDAVVTLPECWLYHPDVVEELLWLMHAWLAAYQGETASVQAAGDWHDRQRPGVVRRIKTLAGSCSLIKHVTRPDRDQYPTGAVPVPGVDAVASIAGWWALARDDAAPEPAPRPQASVARNGAPR